MPHDDLYWGPWSYSVAPSTPVDWTVDFREFLKRNKPSSVVFLDPQQWLLRTCDTGIFYLDPILTSGLLLISNTIKQNVHEIPIGADYA